MSRGRRQCDSCYGGSSSGGGSGGVWISVGSLEVIDSSRLNPNCALEKELRKCLVGCRWRKEGTSLKSAVLVGDR